ncbi:fatty acyl-CoA reductase [Ralstonia pseudosolanacearum]|uniref:fatty acyl-CoA reductase n=1 Tax=Ralstonia pseudosolanacearum TaxID=1310165 RepID=UPI002674A24C|nr:fatty acyl-CoA reductase [Ralstonia pseudosolanacearum]MDO3607270.1 fatty acyl-CoA reductase [Ralstonia pseudosolanacearum]MDO3613256.1 fatty acyl-CoA reductase [Ralstonia pseudosolanacearum]
MSILVTGATGFVGGAIAANLAEKGLLGETRFAVRGESTAEGLARLRANLARFELGAAVLDGLSERQIVPFDLRDAAAAELGDPEILINCAALATFSNHPALWDTNVGGALELGRLASRGKRLKRFVHIGTAMSCGQLADRHVREAWNVPPLEQHAVPYTYSKGMAELKLREVFPELPLVVVRPSIVVGHSRLGCAPSGSIFWMLRMVAMLETFSCRLSDRVDILSVDDCAEAIVRLATRPALAHDLYHISAGDAHSECIETLYPRFKRCASPEEDAQALAGYVYQPKIEEKALARKFLRTTGDGNVRLVARAIHLYAKFASMSYVFDNTRLVAETGFQPRSLLSYLDRCLDTSESESITRQMQWDYK